MNTSIQSQTFTYDLVSKAKCRNQIAAQFSAHSSEFHEHQSNCGRPSLFRFFATILFVCFSIPNLLTSSVVLGQDIPKLIAQLGDVDPDTRAVAEREILGLGTSAIEDISAGIESEDNETRLSCKRLLALLKKKSDIEKRNEFLSADPDDEREFGFSSWPAMKEICGGSQDVRRVFLDIESGLPELFQKIEMENSGGLLVTAKELTRSIDSTNDKSVVPLSAYLLAHHIYLNKNGDESISSITKQESLSHISRLVFVNACNESSEKAVAKKLLTRLLERFNPEYPRLSRSEFRVVFSYELISTLKSINEIWSKLTTIEKRRWFDCAAQSLTEDSNQISLLLNKLDDESVVFDAVMNENTNQEVQVQVRDLAFATLLKIHGESIEDYPFVDTNVNLDFSNQTISGFVDDESRKAAFNKYKINEDGTKEKESDQ